MTNKQLLEKLKEDMELRGFSHWTKDNYYRKAKEITEYFRKPMRQVTTEELRKFLMDYIVKKRGMCEVSANYYNNVIRFIYDVVLDYPINKRQLPLYKKSYINRSINSVIIISGCF